MVIPDPHASYLQGEAEFRGKTVQEHFEEIMLNGMVIAGGGFTEFGATRQRVEG